MNKSYKHPHRASLRLGDFEYYFLLHELRTKHCTKSHEINLDIDFRAEYLKHHKNFTDKSQARRASQLFEKSSEITSEISEINNQIRRIGVNVNQIAKNSNQGKGIDNDKLNNALRKANRNIPYMLIFLGKIANKFDSAVAKIQKGSE